MLARYYTPAQMLALADLSTLVLPTPELFKPTITALISVLKDSVSGVIADPERSFPFFISDKKFDGLVLTLDDVTKQEDPSALPQLISEWGVESVENNYAGAHLTLMYNPLEELALKKKQIVAELYDYCQRQQVPFFLKMVIFWLPDQAQNLRLFQELQLQAVEELRDQADALILQYPQEPLACATLTAELDVPWLVASGATSYDQYKQELRDALEGGAKGAVWDKVLLSDIAPLLTEGEVNPEHIEQIIRTSVRDKCLELRRIIDEFGV